MVSRVLSSLVCVLCLILLPAVLAEYCGSFVDRNGYSHKAVQCSPYYCCGDCTNRQCCQDHRYRFNQDACSGSGGHNKKSRLATLLGSILGSIFPILLCVGLVICCVAPCCLFYKKCRKGRGRSGSAAGGPIFNVPMRPQPLPDPHPSGYPSQPGYQPVPAQPGFGGLPFPSAPPSYGNPNNPPGVYPMLPLQFAEPPPKTDEEAPQPYNPSFP